MKYFDIKNGIYSTLPLLPPLEGGGELDPSADPTSSTQAPAPPKVGKAYIPLDSRLPPRLTWVWKVCPSATHLLAYRNRNEQYEVRDGYLRGALS